MTFRFVKGAPAVGDLHRLLLSSLPAERIGLEDLTRKILLDPNLAEEGSISAFSGSELIGYCLAITRQVPLENAPLDVDRGFITLLAVHPRFRRQGVGSSLLGAAEQFLVSTKRTSCWISPYAPNYFVPGVDVSYDAGLQFLGTYGFASVFEAISMGLPLTGELREPEWVTVLRSRASTLTIEHPVTSNAWQVLEFVRQEFPGDWVRVVRESIVRRTRGDVSTGIIALSNEGEIKGFAHYDGERFGPIGVSASARGRGYGQILMFEALREQLAAGANRSYFLWSEDRTAERLYRHAGFALERRFRILRKDLAPNRDTQPGPGA